MRVVVSYDLSDDKRRREVAKIMEGYGYRVQYSVFECELSKQKLRRLQQQLRPLVQKQAGESVRFYPLSATSANQVEVIGHDMARTLGRVEIV